MSQLADIQPIKKNAEVVAKRGTHSWLNLEHCRDHVPFTDLREEDVSHGLFICIEESFLIEARRVHVSMLPSERMAAIASGFAYHVSLMQFLVLRNIVTTWTA